MWHPAEVHHSLELKIVREPCRGSSRSLQQVVKSRIALRKPARLWLRRHHEPLDTAQSGTTGCTTVLRCFACRSRQRYERGGEADRVARDAEQLFGLEPLLLGRIRSDGRRSWLDIPTSVSRASCYYRAATDARFARDLLKGPFVPLVPAVDVATSGSASCHRLCTITRDGRSCITDTKSRVGGGDQVRAAPGRQFECRIQSGARPRHTLLSLQECMVSGGLYISFVDPSPS